MATHSPQPLLEPAFRGESTAQDAHHLAPGAEHVVRFYEDERFLCRAVAEHLAEWLAAGQHVVAISTQPRLRAFASLLSDRGIDIDRARANRQFIELDARQTLSAFMVGHLPDQTRFHAVFGPVIAGAARRSAGARLYGDMVDLLVHDGNSDAAIRVEELWNELASVHQLSLLCAYDLRHFRRAADADRFRAICERHGRVIPTERYTLADNSARSMEISLLQQRAQALAAEVEHRKALEGQLRDALAERERLLAQEQEARAEAEAANRAKSQFLAVMSHELRTPLNAIGGHVQLIEMGLHGALSDAQREALARVQRSQRHLLILINDVLNLARIEAGRVEYTLERVLLEPLLSEVVSLVEPLVRANGLTCEIDLAPRGTNGAREIAVRADREKVQQILLNLLTNAIRFTPAGGRITVDLTPSSSAPAVARVRVCDTGAGIPAAKLERIFDPFVQLGNPGQGAPREGVGLGLAISRDLARGMGGDLTAVSVVGAGSKFTLTLPLL